MEASTPDRKPIEGTALPPRCRGMYNHNRQTLEREGFTTGSEAIRAVASQVHTGTFGAGAREFMTGFSFPLSAQRALDYAAFLEIHQGRLSEIKHQQAHGFGVCQMQAMARDRQLSETLYQLANWEDAFHEIVTGEAFA
jgi:hypothetical protein